MKPSEKKCFLFSLNVLMLSFYVNGQNPGDNIFNSPMVHKINIAFYEGNYWNKLLMDKKEGDETGLSYYSHADILFDSVEIKDIGVRLKGNSSYEHPGQKKPIKLSFNEFAANQELDGLKQLNLHNGYLDPTMMREKLFLDFFNEQKLPAPRCTYAAVSFNGEYVGLYKVVEEIDKRFLKNRFGNNKGNLFKGDPNGRLDWLGAGQANYYEEYSLKNNEKENNWTDIVNFIHKINFTAAENFSGEIETVFNTTSFIKAWAADVLFVNSDSYMLSFGHNYYLYDNPVNGKFEFISWDVGLAFGVFPFLPEKKAVEYDMLNTPANENRRPLTVRMMETDDYKNEYLNSICGFLYSEFTPEKLFPAIDSLANVIRPYIYSEPDKNQMFTEKEFEAGLNDGTIDNFLYDIPGLKSFISKRRENVKKQLCENLWSCAAGKDISAVEPSVINIFPNPANENVTISFSVLEPEVNEFEIRVRDISGRNIRTMDAFPLQNQSIQINSGQLPEGLYIVTPFSSCEHEGKKMIIER